MQTMQYAHRDAEIVHVPAGTTPQHKPSPDPGGWGWKTFWEAVGFQPDGKPPYAVPKGGEVIIRETDLLGPDHDPVRVVRMVRYVAE